MAIDPKAKLIKGTQIAYVPTHANGDVNHPDVQFGFVTSGPTSTNAYFCRYWYGRTKELRTKANSELTPGECLIEYPLFTGDVVAFAIKEHVDERIKRKENK